MRTHVLHSLVELFQTGRREGRGKREREEGEGIKRGGEEERKGGRKERKERRRGWRRE